MTVRIGVDMDGVILDNYARWADYYNTRKVAHKHAEDCVDNPPTWSYYPELCPECYKYVVNGLDIETPLVKGTTAGLQQLRRLGELWVISHRDTSLTGTASELLKRHDIYKYFSAFNWSFDPKLETCLKNGISVLIDDSPRNIESLYGSPVTPIIFDYEYNRHVSGLRAYNWGDVVRLCRHVLSSSEAVAV